MRRRTTPTIFISTRVDLTEADVIFATFAQLGENVIERTKENMEVSADGLRFALTQEETGKLKKGVVEVQIAYRKGGYVDRSDIVSVKVNKILKDEDI